MSDDVSHDLSAVLNAVEHDLMLNAGEAAEFDTRVAPTGCWPASYARGC